MNTLPARNDTDTQSVIDGAISRTVAISSGPVLSFTVPPPDIARFGKLTDDVKSEVLTLLGTMQRIRAAKSIEAGCRDVALLTGLNAGTLRRQWYQFARHGWRALVDCAKEGCTRESLWAEDAEKPAADLTPEFIEWFR